MASHWYRRSRYRCPVGLAITERWVLGGRWVLGVGCWVLGRLWVLGAPGRRRGHFTGTSMARLEAPTEHIRAMWSPSLYVPRRDSYCRALGVWVLGVGCWVFGCWVLGARQGRPGVRRLKGRWVALPPPVSRRPGWYTSPRPRRRRPQRGGDESPEPPPTP